MIEPCRWSCVPQAGGTYHELQRRWKSLSDSHSLRLHELSCGNVQRSLLCVELGDERAPLVALSAGVHGDEPARPWALLQLVEARALDERLRYQIFPCTNPSGFVAKTRKNADGVDVNRSFHGGGGTPEARAVLAQIRGRRYMLSLDLHEDCDAVGFYCYEYGAGDIGRHVIAALVADGFAIDPLKVTFGLAGPLDDAHCVADFGRIVADAFTEAGLLSGLSYSLVLARDSARHALTLETPSASSWKTRLAMHRTAVRAAIAAVLEESPSQTCK